MTSSNSLLRRPNVGGLVLGLLFWWKSLSPLLLPRSSVAQAMVGAVCLCVGYMVGTLVGYWMHRLLRRIGKQPSPIVRRRVWTVVGAISAIVVVVGLVVWPRWQNDHRDLLGMEHISPASAIPMALVTVVLVAVLTLIGRVAWAAMRWVERQTSRRLARPASVTVSVLVIVLVANFLFTNVLAGRFHSWSNSTFGAIQDDTAEGVTQPTSSAVSGSPSSLVPWADLGREGRNFVASQTSVKDLEAFSAAGTAKVTEPVRVYVGLRSPGTAEARADLAVRELERAGGFDRSVLVVWTVTGTGWVDPDATVALEQMYGGDTAIVGLQYSFLPSWISTLVDGPVAHEAGAVLFNAVQRHWAQLPVATRPKLVVFGLSLGSFGGEAPFAGIDARSSTANMASRTDGVLFVGPTEGNLIHRQLTGDRDSGSPAWRPVIDAGSTVRFANDPADLAGEADPAWPEPRVLYLQHPTDPVTFWNWRTMWAQPAWLDGQLGAGVAERASWFPFVSWAQLVGDLSAGFGAKPGFGHDYTNAYVAAWASVIPPDGWTKADTGRLEEFLGVPR